MHCQHGLFDQRGKNTPYLTPKPSHGNTKFALRVGIAQTYLEKIDFELMTSSL